VTGEGLLLAEEVEAIARVLWPGSEFNRESAECPGHRTFDDDDQRLAALNDDAGQVMPASSTSYRASFHCPALG